MPIIIVFGLIGLMVIGCIASGPPPQPVCPQGTVYISREHVCVPGVEPEYHP